MNKVISIFCLLSLVACSSYNTGRRKEDREYTKKCIADLYNEGLAGELAIKACKELTYQ